MTTLNLGESRITHRQQIVQLLKMAIDQKWRFSYVTVVRNHVATQPVHLRSVSAMEGKFAVEPAIERNEQNLSESIIFRGQSGGISVVFKARVSGFGDQVNPAQPGPHRFLDLPYEVRCTQLRKSIRLNVESRPQEVQVTLYLAMGMEINAVLVDISTTGAQFRVANDVSDKLRNPQLLEACRIELSDELTLRCGAQLLGLNYNSNSNVSYLRCQLVDMVDADEQRLEQYIDDHLNEVDPASVASIG